MPIPNNNTLYPEFYLDSITILRIMKDVSECLDSIKSFAAGYEYEPNRLDDLEYPLLFLETPQAIEITERVKKITFGFMVLNRFTEGQSGERTPETAQYGVYNLINREEYRLLDVIGTLRKQIPKVVDTFDFIITPIFEGFEDRAYGWRVDMTFKGPGIDWCFTQDNVEHDCLNLENYVYRPAECELTYDAENSQLLASIFGITSPEGGTNTQLLVTAFTGDAVVPFGDVTATATDGVTTYDVIVAEISGQDNTYIYQIDSADGWLGIENLVLTVTTPNCEFEFTLPYEPPAPLCELNLDQSLSAQLAVTSGTANTPFSITQPANFLAAAFTVSGPEDCVATEEPDVEITVFGDGSTIPNSSNYFLNTGIPSLIVQSDGSWTWTDYTEIVIEFTLTGYETTTITFNP